MTPREAERCRRQSEHDRANPDDHRVLSFRQWCDLNGFSVSTGRRIINAGTGPEIVQLSPRRIGISVAANAKWLASRVRGEV
jgi:predicted DNA-binding transcriptional regulator AlpA